LDRRELFHIALDGKLTATAISPGADDQSLEAAAPLPLFAAQVGSVVWPVLAANYAPSADGQRFLVKRLVRDAGGTPLRVVLNWHPEAR
jgi:hypothetical protein